jgi:hypothetical protein
MGALRNPVILPVFKTGGRPFRATVCSTHTRFRHFFAGLSRGTGRGYRGGGYVVLDFAGPQKGSPVLLGAFLLARPASSADSCPA